MTQYYIMKSIKLESTNNNDVAKIWHMADIHIRLELKRLVEYEEVFQRLFETMKQQKDEAIAVVCGDLLHSKNELNPEAIQLLITFLKGLGEICDVIVIMGNHDCILSNKNRLDSLTPIVEEISCAHKIHYLRESGVYEYKNIMFGVSSVIDGQFIKASTIKLTRKDQYKIALFHGPIHNSITDVGHRMNNCEHTLTSFKGYSYVLLGDIHRHQYIDDVSKRVCYPSSLVQQNFGEDPTMHGVVKWDLINNKSEFIKIYNQYGFVTLKVKDGEIVGNPYIHQKPYIRMELTNTSKAQYIELCNSLKNKYEVQSITFCNIDEHVNDEGDGEQKGAVGNTMIENINDVSHQNNLIKDYINAHCKYSEKDIKRLLDLNETYNKKIKSVVDRQANKWVIKQLEFSNMFCYGEDNKIDFSKMKNIVSLSAPNHCGKSSLLDVLLFALFDKCSRGSRNDVLNRKKDSCYCKLTFEIDGVEYVIERIGKTEAKKKFRIDVEFKREDIDSKKKKKKSAEKEYVSLTGKDRNETNSIIEQYIGSYDDYILTSMCLQKDINFLDQQQSKRKDFLIRLLKLEVFEELLKCAKEDYKRWNISYNDKVNETANFNIDDVRAKMKELEESKDKLTEENVVLKNELDAIYDKSSQLNKAMNVMARPEEYLEVGTLKTKKSTLEKKSSSISGQLKKIEEIIKNKTEELDKLNSKFRAIDFDELVAAKNNFEKAQKKQLLDMNTKLTKLYGSKKNVQKFSKTEEGYADELAQLKSKIEGHRAGIKTMTNNIAGLEKSIVEVANSEIVRANYKEFNELTDMRKTLMGEVDTLNKTIIDMKDKLEKLAKHEYDPNCKFCVNNAFVKDAIATKKKLDPVVKQRDELVLKLGGINERLEGLKDASVHYETMNSVVKANADATNKLTNLRLKLELMNKELGLDEDKKKDVMQMIKDIKKDGSNIKFNEDVDNKIVALKEDIEKCEGETYGAYGDYLEQKEAVDDLEAEIKNDRYELLTLQGGHRDICDEIGKVQKQIDDISRYVQIEAANKKLQTELDKLKSRKKDIEKTMGENNENILKMNSDLAMLVSDKNAYDNNISRLTEYDALRSITAKYIGLVDKNGLPARLFGSIIPEIERKVNAVLCNLVQFSVAFELGDDNSIYIYKIHDVYKHDIDLCSTFERFMVSTAVRLVITQLSNSCASNFMIIDEGFTCLDATNIGNLENLFEFMRNNFDFVILISHMQTIKGLCDDAITIRVEGGFSYIQDK
jgi:DNA repair exonuclease SbcCD ATPase subunit/DNA repair exonuclease SbcCD nuclease subunit